MADLDDVDVALSRPALSSPLGKLDEKMHVFLDEATANELRKRAADMEQLPAQWIRDQLYLAIHGKTELELLAEHRRKLRDLQGVCKRSARAVQ